MADTEELIRRAIHVYFESDPVFAQDLINFNQLLTEDKLIVKFCHLLNCNVFDDESKRFIAESSQEFCDLFGRCLREKVTAERLNQKKIWLCVKFRNLPENLTVTVKSKEEWEQLGERVTIYTLDCIQIVSLTNSFQRVYGRKYMAKASERVEHPVKWATNQIHDRTRDTFSDKYYESKKDRLYFDGRKFLATIGTKVTEDGSKPIEVHVYTDTLTVDEVNAIYNGSHLESVILYNSPMFGLTLLSFDKTLRPIPRVVIASEFEQYLTQFPDDVQNIYEDRRNAGSSYSFPQSLAYIFGDNISKAGSFFRFKLGLLLSLLSFNDSKAKKNHLSVLAVCDDTLMVRRLFEWSSFMIENRFLHKSLAIPMTGVARSVCQEDKSYLTYVDSGSLQYGADGVTVIECVDNLNELPDKERTALFHALVTNDVIAKQSQSIEPKLTEHQLKSTVWAAIEDDINEKQTKSTRGQNILWLEVFGMVYVVPQPPKGYIYCKVLGREDGTLSFETWQKTIELMSQIDPQMEETSERLITQYYMASRRVRGAKMNHLAVETLTSLSKSFAKLSLRLKITELDAVMAILLYEESLVSRFPHIPSQIVDQPIIHVREDLLDEVIGNNCDKNIDDFKCRLIEFISREVKRKPTLSEILAKREE